MYGNKLGDMAWMDLSVFDAEHIKDFYHKVLGWQSEAIAMTDKDEKYSDFVMSAKSSENEMGKNTEKASNSDFVTGICHARGTNTNMPATWLPYFLVANIDTAVVIVQTEGGELVTEIKSIGDDKFVVIKDPAGAQCALYQKIAKN